LSSAQNRTVGSQIDLVEKIGLDARLCISPDGETKSVRRVFLQQPRNNKQLQRGSARAGRNGML
jgi:hypothetical protein